MRNFSNVLFILAMLFAAACGPEQFSTKKKQDNQSTNPVQITTNQLCSSFTLVKPKVDFLFLWDNSTSTVFINDQTKSALNNVVNYVSSNFDFHITMAPLIKPSGTDPLYFMSEDTISPSGMTKIDPSIASNVLNFPSVAGSAEEGITRAYDLIRNNATNNAFRANTYLIVVLMSNEDDNKWVTGSFPIAQDQVNYINSMKQKLLCLRGQHNGGVGCTGISLNSIMMRFMSVVAANDTTCPGVSLFKKGDTYMKISREIVQAPYDDNRAMPSDPSAVQINPDVYNICGVTDFSHVFDSIESAIQPQILSHKYDFWPVAGPGASAIDPDEIKVFKNGQEFFKLTTATPNKETDNGFTFLNSVRTVNTRYAPTSGEPFTGYSIELFGNARVNYPECMTVTTQTPKEFFGYVQMAVKPVESTIVLKINGQTVPKSATNGWQLLKDTGGQPKYFSSQNIKITGPGDFCPSTSTDYCGGSPAVNKSGYFLQVFGTAVYSNGATLEVTYDPSL